MINSFLIQLNSNLTNLSTTLNNKAGLGENAYSGRQSITSTAGLRNDAYAHAQVTVRTPYYLNNSARAMIGFENMGNNAEILFLDSDGRLKWYGHDGVLKVID